MPTLICCQHVTTQIMDSCMLPHFLAARWAPDPSHSQLNLCISHSMVVYVGMAMGGSTLWPYIGKFTFSFAAYWKLNTYV